MPLYYKILGQGKNLVLLHGWGFSSAIMQPLAEKLAKYYCVTLIDLPGFGQSQSIEPYTLDNLAENIHSLIPQNSTLIGWSFGGLIALKLTMLYPQKVNSIIALASTPCFFAHNHWPGISLPLLTTFEEKLLQNAQDLLQYFALLQTQGENNPLKAHRFVKNQLLQEKAPALNALTGGLMILKNTDLRALLLTIQCPMQFIFAANDKIVPIETSRQLAKRVPSAEIQIIANAAHLFFLFHSDKTIAHIINFIENTKYP